MFKGHPKGLFVAFFANMGERFGYYTMLAIFVLYLQAKFGWTTGHAGNVYGAFLFGIYFLPLLGGYLADNVLGYGRTITLGIVVMFLGYFLLALPGISESSDLGLGTNLQYFIFVALAVISLGTGFFKGNLQALVGNLYDDPKYSKFRDSAFNLFYMGINIGAMFAPHAARGARNLMLKAQDFTYNKGAADLAHNYLDGTLEKTAELEQIAQAQMGANFTNVTEFANKYIDALGQSYNAGFAVAAISMIVSLVIFQAFKKYYKHADKTHKEMQKSQETKVEEMPKTEVRQRLVALGLVFLVVIFFWMAFHQNGLAFTVFARDYVVETVDQNTAVLFNIIGFISIIAVVYGLVMIFGQDRDKKSLFSGIGVIGVAIAIFFLIRSRYEPAGNEITPELFQHFNPGFIIFLTPIVVGIFSVLRKRGREPSSPKKIGIGMILTALGYVILLTVSRTKGLPAPGETTGVSDVLISPYYLIGTYFTLTIAELFLSPIGISFVSKVSPPQYKGLMQGGWLAATATGNLLAGLIGNLWDLWELWQFFAFVIGLCVLAAIFMFSILKRLEKASGGQ